MSLSSLALQHLLAEFAKLPFGTIINIMRKTCAIFSLVLELDFLEMSRFPVESHKAADEKFGTIFGCLC